MSSSPDHLTPAQKEVELTIRTALDRLAETQEEDGSWWGDYGGPMFLLPMYIALCHITERTIPEEKRNGMVREFREAMGPDGEIGLHREGPPCLFTTILAYVSLRLLDEPSDEPGLTKMRAWIAENGTPLGAAPWGKWILCLLGLYRYRGINPIPPELWLLPRWFPLHPGRLWCHCRMVYLPASWLYGKRAAIEPNSRIHSLREELYDKPWNEIDFCSNRSFLAPLDNLEPPRLPVRIANRLLCITERFMPKSLRDRALHEVERQMDFEEVVTNGIAIGPVNRVLNAVCFHFSEPGSERSRNAAETCDHYLWETDGRCIMQGYNNSKLWDTAFALQAAIEAGKSRANPDIVTRGFSFIRKQQVLENVPERIDHYRDPSVGGWPFSDLEHGWPISDCTAEGLKTSLLVAKEFPDLALPDSRLQNAIGLLLELQNPDGGWPTYEKRRAGNWLEWFNPSGVFSRIMVDYSYPECTSAVIQSLVAAHKWFPEFRRKRVESALVTGERYLRKSQRDDGSWEGSWGVCFTYGTWFGVSGLRAAGAQPSDQALKRASAFLLARQRKNGSWGEDARSCHERTWIESPEGHVVQTAWSLLALLEAEDSDTEAQDRAAQFLIDRQEKSGGWPNEGMVGMFNRTCAIHYDFYRAYFPLRALAKWSKKRFPS